MGVSQNTHVPSGSQAPAIREHVEFVPSRIIGVKIKYLIAALLQHGMTIEKISECIDWAEDLMEVDAKMHENEDILNLAARF